MSQNATILLSRAMTVEDQPGTMGEVRIFAGTISLNLSLGLSKPHSSGQ